MYICVCYGVTENEVRKVAREGISTLPELKQLLGVSSGCGKCAECALDILKQTFNSLPENQTLNHVLEVA